MAAEWDLSSLIIAQTNQCQVLNLILSEKASENRIFYKKNLKMLDFTRFYVTPKKKNLLKNIMEMYHLIRQGQYDAVHVHFEEWSFFYICGLLKYVG